MEAATISYVITEQIINILVGTIALSKSFFFFGGGGNNVSLKQVPVLIILLLVVNGLIIPYALISFLGEVRLNFNGSNTFKTMEMFETAVVGANEN